MALTYSLAEAAEQICADSMKNPALWLRRQIRAGRFKAIKVGRHVRMTDRQIEAAIEALEIGTAPESTPVRRGGITLTPASMRRRSM